MPRIETLPVPRWQCDITVVIDDNAAYFAIASLCAVLGIRTQRQTERLHADPRFSPHLRKYDIRTSRGLRPFHCLLKDKLGSWLNSIQPQRIRPEMRARLVAFQDDMDQLADQLLFREHQRGQLRLLSPSTPGEQRAAPSQDEMSSWVSQLEDRLGAVETRVFVPEDPEDSVSQPGDVSLACPHCGGRIWLQVGTSGKPRLIHDDDPAEE